MSYTKAGFKNTLRRIGGNSVNINEVTSGGVLKTKQIPTSLDGINFSLPTSIPIIPGSLAVSINGLTTIAYEELPDGMSFEYTGSMVLDLTGPDPDVLITMYMV